MSTVDEKDSLSKLEYVYKGFKTGLYKTNRENSTKLCDLCKGRLIKVFDNFHGFVIYWCPDCGIEEIVEIVAVPERTEEEVASTSRYTFSWVQK